MAEFSERILREFKRHIILIGIGLVVLIIINFLILFEAKQATDVSRLAVLVANQSENKASSAFNQSQSNAEDIEQHSDLVGKHSNDTLKNGKQILNNTDLLIALHKKIQ